MTLSGVVSRTWADALITSVAVVSPCLCWTHQISPRMSLFGFLPNTEETPAKSTLPSHRRYKQPCVRRQNSIWLIIGLGTYG
ncbi:hypothetical protein CPB84DRAFT_1781475 [Gymnopilus junonius]|uniref:Uncharacterized protein n=1 Tax=Gymnopilus junonius TaxID=109634 RepID=A0A9P5NMR2_GYMJU|nr:hypothetical protein CPB84DRAFT_1781475 [Gymnopilus junonius]